jgi:hypothetical protein
MLIIAHRGNLNGPSEDENSPNVILETIKRFYCEVDLWVTRDQLYLGHDGPRYKIDSSFLQSDRLFIHAKNLDAVKYLKNTE